MIHQDSGVKTDKWTKPENYNFQDLNLCTICEYYETRFITYVGRTWVVLKFSIYRNRFPKKGSIIQIEQKLNVQCTR